MCACLDGASTLITVTFVGELELAASEHRWHCFAGTRMLILENVVSGSIQELMVRELEKDYHIHVLHCATQDSGYGSQRRMRGWSFGCILCVKSVHQVIGGDQDT